MVKIAFYKSFIKKTAKLKKKFSKVGEDIFLLVEEIKKNPRVGTSLGHNLFKSRVKNSNKTQGKSGGYRIITYYLTSNNEVYFIDIYDKGDKENFNKDEIQSIMKDIKQNT
jgi:mRNA-degrading endonuclease RelE of RelBE toxin-antitoxin system